MTFAWTDERIEKLKRDWAAGFSCDQIAKRFGGLMSRCAVIGKVRRLKLPYRIDPQAKPFDEINHKRRHRKRNGFKSGAVSLPHRKAPGNNRKEAAPPCGLSPAHPLNGTGVPFLQRKVGQCAYPLWNDSTEERLCCGNKTYGFSSWCYAHFQRVSA